MTDPKPKRPTPTNGGRPPGSKSLRTKAARAADMSLAVLERVQEDESAPAMARVLAAQTIIAAAGMPVGKATGQQG